MLINADFSRPVIVAVNDYRWTASPQPGVERMMLDRLGAEKARATSIVRYAPASHFSPHTHPGEEEIFVLSGVFSDGDGDYPSGWYLRNPPGSWHRPFTSQGAIIFVKLWQMGSSEEDAVRIDTRVDAGWHNSVDGDIFPLFRSESEDVCLLRLGPGAAMRGRNANTELVVMNGSICVSGHQYRRGSWMRFPKDGLPSLTAGQRGARVYVKTTSLDDLGLKR
jgi:anti-sigma factor ChrR (cupin superfamily)